MGGDFDHRWTQTRESVLAMKELWTKPEAEFHRRRSRTRDPSAITISVHGQPADRDLIRRLRDAGANRVIVRPPTVKTESEMAAGLTRIAEAVLR